MIEAYAVFQAVFCYAVTAAKVIGPVRLSMVTHAMSGIRIRLWESTLVRRNRPARRTTGQSHECVRDRPVARV
jgi:hypothetical protein